ncbi:MAG: DUF3035 domain-containing protein [Stellaceae bacterium]
MSEFYRGGGRAIAALSALCLIGTLALSGCSGVKKAIGLEPTMPDEFEVEAQAPLTIPPDFALRPPKPGTPRPQDVSTAKLARQDLDTVGAGKPGQQVAGLTLPVLGGSLQAPNPNAEIVPGSLASKLLASGTGGAVIENRQTTPLPGVY